MMKIVIIASAESQKEVESKLISNSVQVIYASTIENLISDADAYFYLKTEKELQQDLLALSKISVPVFANAISTALSALPKNFVRINGWCGFIEKEQLEIACSQENKLIVEKILALFNWKYILVPDILGLITPRIISMIINEAYFALEDNVSTKENIDIAMKLGTNYPFGPFEWSEKIGVENIVQLLNNLSKEDEKYMPAPLLIKSIS